MSPQGVYPAADVCAIGDEISSTYEGRHITLYADNLTHSNALAVVTKGYPVIWGDTAVGVAFATQPAGTNPLIAVDTEGIWCQDVFAQNDAGVSNVIPGDELYIDETTLLISKIRNPATNRPFGFALGTITGGNTERIAVKVHWEPKENELGDDERLYFGADHDFSIYWTGGAGGWLNIVAATGGSVSFYAPGGVLITGPVTINDNLTIAATLTMGAIHCNGNCDIAGVLGVAAHLVIVNIPVADPLVPGELWDNNHIVTRSWG